MEVERKIRPNIPCPKWLMKRPEITFTAGNTNQRLRRGIPEQRKKPVLGILPSSDNPVRRAPPARADFDCGCAIRPLRPSWIP